MTFCLIFGNCNCDTDVFSAIVPVVLKRGEGEGGEKKKNNKTRTWNKIFCLRHSLDKPGGKSAWENGI